MGRPLAYIFQHDIIVIVNEHVLRCFKVSKYGNIVTPQLMEIDELSIIDQFSHILVLSVLFYQIWIELI